jgi:murein DD-endopeptidase MepM/ murein hydrolase activator NlpD
MIKFKVNPTSNQRITSEFGKREFAGMQFHSGIDFGAIEPGVEGDELYAVADGTVRVSKVDSGNINVGYGNYIIIEHEEYCTLYAHLQKLELKVGVNVKAGQVIGHMGNTGESTAAHLHFELRNCSYSNPYFWTKGSYKGQFLMCINPIGYFIHPHWAQEKLENLQAKGIIDSPEVWKEFDKPCTNAQVLAIIDKITDRV